MRETYLPSGRVSWGRLLGWIPVALPLVLLSRWVFSLFIRAGLYSPFLGPWVAALPAAGAAYFLAWSGRCRHRGVGAAVGLLTGLIAFLDCYQFEFARFAGPQALPRIDLLPHYL